MHIAILLVKVIFGIFSVIISLAAFAGLIMSLFSDKGSEPEEAPKSIEEQAGKLFGNIIGS